MGVTSTRFSPRNITPAQKENLQNLQAKADRLEKAIEACAALTVGSVGVFSPVTVPLSALLKGELNRTEASFKQAHDQVYGTP